MHRSNLLTALALASTTFVASTPSFAGPTTSPTPRLRAQDAPALKVGDVAPALTVEKWVKGSPVASFEKGQVYVVEFWATWCGPCIASMPHLSALQREHAEHGVTIIGMTSVDSKGNSLEKVEQMVAAKGDGMGYTVAWDVDRTTNTAFMKAAGRGGIPCSFLVDKEGRLAYIGHPLFLGEPLAGVLDGTWKIENAPAYEQLQNDYWSWRSKTKRDPSGALAFIRKFELEHPLLANLSTQMKFDAAVAAGDSATISAAGALLVDEAVAAKNWSALNSIAWTLVDPQFESPKRDLVLAMRAAKAAVDLTEGKNPSVLDTLARVHYWKSDLATAIELQTKAVDQAEGKTKESLQKTLEEYKAKASS